MAWLCSGLDCIRPPILAKIPRRGTQIAHGEPQAARGAASPSRLWPITENQRTANHDALCSAERRRSRLCGLGCARAGPFNAAFYCGAVIGSERPAPVFILKIGCSVLHTSSQTIAHCAILAWQSFNAIKMAHPHIPCWVRCMNHILHGPCLLYS